MTALALGISAGCAPVVTRADAALTRGDLDQAERLLQRAGALDEPQADILRLQLSEQRQTHLETLSLADEFLARGRLSAAQAAPSARRAAAATEDAAAWATWWLRSVNELPVQQVESATAMLAFRTHLRTHDEIFTLTDQLLQLDLPTDDAQAIANFVELNIYRLIYEREFDAANALIDSLASRLQPDFVAQKLRIALLLQSRADSGPRQLEEFAGDNDSLLEALAFDFGARGLHLASARAWELLGQLRGAGATAAYAYRTSAESWYRADQPTPARRAVELALRVADRPALMLGELVRVMNDAHETDPLLAAIESLSPPTPCQPSDTAEWIMLENAVAEAAPNLMHHHTDWLAQRYENLYRACATPEVTDAAMATFLYVGEGERALQFGLRGLDTFGATSRRLSLLVASASRAGDATPLVNRINEWFEAGADPAVMDIGEVIEALDASTEPALIELRGELLVWAMTQGTPPLPLALRRATALQQAGRIDERRELIERVIATADDSLNALAQFSEWMVAQNVDPVERLEFLQRVVDHPDSSTRPGLRGPSGGADMRQRALWLQILAAYDAVQPEAVFNAMLTWVQAAGADDPDVWQTLWTQRRALTLLGPEERIELGRRSIAAGYDGVEIHRSVADSLLSLGRTDEAVAAYEQAVDNEPGIAPLLVESLADDGRPDIAVRVLERFRSIRGDSIPVLMQCAELYSELADRTDGHHRATFRRTARAIYAELAEMPGAWTRIDPYVLERHHHVDLAARIGLGRLSVTEEREPAFVLHVAVWVAQSGGDAETIRELAGESIDKASPSAQSRALSALERAGYRDITVDLLEQVYLQRLDEGFDTHWLQRLLDAAIESGDPARARRIINTHTIDMAQALIDRDPTVPRAMSSAGDPDTTAARLLTLGAARLMNIGEVDAANAAAESGLRLRDALSEPLLVLALRSRAAQVTYPLDQNVIDNYVFLSGLGSAGWLSAARQLGADGYFDAAFYALDRYFDLATEHDEGLAALGEIAANAGRTDLLVERWEAIADDATIAELLNVLDAWKIQLAGDGLAELWGDFVLDTEKWFASSPACARLVVDELIRRGELDRARTLTLRNNGLDTLSLEQLYAIGLQDEALMRLQQRRNLADPVERETQLTSLEDVALQEVGAESWESTLRAVQNDTGRVDLIAQWRMQRWAGLRGHLSELADRLGSDSPIDDPDSAYGYYAVQLMHGDLAAALQTLQALANGQGENVSIEPEIDPERIVATTLAIADLDTLRFIAEHIDGSRNSVHHAVLQAWVDLLDGNLLAVSDRMTGIIVPAAQAELRFELARSELQSSVAATLSLLRAIDRHGLHSEAVYWTRLIAESTDAVDLFDLALVELLVQQAPDDALMHADTLMARAGNDTALGLELLQSLSGAPGADPAARPWFDAVLQASPDPVLRRVQALQWSESQPSGAEQEAYERIDVQRVHTTAQIQRAQALALGGHREEMRAVLDEIPRQTLQGQDWVSLIALYATNNQTEAAQRELRRMLIRDESRVSSLIVLMTALPRVLYPEIGQEIEQSLLRYHPAGWTAAITALRTSALIGLSDARQRALEALELVAAPEHGSRLRSILDVIHTREDGIVDETVWLSVLAATERADALDSRSTQLLMIDMLAVLDPVEATARLLDFTPTTSTDAAGQAARLVDLGQFDHAEAVALGMLEAHPSSAPPHQILALCDIHRGRPEEAMEHAAVIVNDGALMLELLPPLVQAMTIEGQTEQAIELALSLATVVDVAPAAAAFPPRNGLAAALNVFIDNDPETGVRFVERLGINATTIDDQAIVEQRIANGLGTLYASAGRLDEATAMMERLDFDPALALNNIAYLLADHGGDAELAEQLARRSLSVDDFESANTVDTLAWALFQQGRPDDALPIMEQAFATASRSFDIPPSSVRVFYEHLQAIRAAMPVVEEPTEGSRRRRGRRRDR